MSNFKFKNFVLKRYYLFDWTGDIFFGEGFLQKYVLVLCRRTDRCSPKLMKRSLKNTGRCQLKIMRDDLKKVPRGFL